MAGRQRLREVVGLMSWGGNAGEEFALGGSRDAFSIDVREA